MSAHHHPHASVLRQRAADLRELARAVESAAVMSLDGTMEGAPWGSARTRLCAVMLDQNVMQLHRAVEDLREAAFRLQARADEFDRSHP